MRVAAAIALSDETRLQLEKACAWALDAGSHRAAQSDCSSGRGRSSEQADCRADGGCASDGGLVARPFLTLGVDGLLRDASRPGRTPSISTQTVTQVIEKTTQSKPANATHWSRSTMARVVGISESSVGRIWRSHGLKPHRVTSFKVSNDPLFADKLEAIVGFISTRRSTRWCCRWMRRARSKR